MHGPPPISNARPQSAACPTVLEEGQWQGEPTEETTYPHPGYHVSGNLWNLDSFVFASCDIDAVTYQPKLCLQVGIQRQMSNVLEPMQPWTILQLINPTWKDCSSNTTRSEHGRTRCKIKLQEKLNRYICNWCRWSKQYRIEMIHSHGLKHGHSVQRSSHLD